jgi:hypothetical protein
MGIWHLVLLIGFVVLVATIVALRLAVRKLSSPGENVVMAIAAAVFILVGVCIVAFMVLSWDIFGTWDETLTLLFGLSVTASLTGLAVTIAGISNWE